MPDMRISMTVAGGGDTIARSITRVLEGATSRKVTLPAAKTGTLSTRTDNETGTLTMADGHGITTGAVIDLYWDGGMRYGVEVGTVSVNSVPIDNGSGDNLPSQTTAITASVQTEIEAAIDGDALDSLAIDFSQAASSSTAKGHLDFQETDGTSVAPIDVAAGQPPQVFDITGGATNPFTGDPIAKIMATNGDSAGVATLKVIWGGDATP